MKNTIYKTFLSFLALVLGVFINAQKPPANMPPPTAESGDIGGISQPIDNYIVLLMLVAVFAIGFFARKYKTANSL